MQASEGSRRHRSELFDDEAKPWRFDGEGGACVSAGGRLQPDLGIEVLLEVTPAEAYGRLDHGHDDQPFSARASQEPGVGAARHLPAGPLGQAATVGPDCRVPGPPVGEVIGLREQLPDVVGSRDQLFLRLESHDLRLSRFRHDSVTHACAFPRYRHSGEEATGT